MRSGARDAPSIPSRVLVHNGQREVATEVLQVRDRPGEPGGRTIVRYLDGPDAGAIRSDPVSQVCGVEEPRPAAGPGQTPDTPESRRGPTEICDLGDPTLLPSRR